MTRASDNIFPKLIGSEAAAPGTPAAATSILYVKADGLWYSKDDAGTETLVSGGSGGGSVATDAIWDVAGDLAVGTGANTAARLALGAAGGALSRVNGAAAWNSGTSFPTAASGDRYWRTDLGLEFYYDGTRWLTTTLYTLQSNMGDSLFPMSANGAAGRSSLWNDDFALWLVSLYGITYTNAPNDASNYWTISAQGAVTGTTYGSFNTSTDTAGVYTGHEAALNQVAGATERGINIVAAKGGVTTLPGSIYCPAIVSYRLIGT